MRIEDRGSRIEERGSRNEDRGTRIWNSRNGFSVFRPGGASDSSRWRNHRYRRRWKLASWKDAGPKLRSVALSGLEGFGRLSSGGFSTGYYPPAPLARNHIFL